MKLLTIITPTYNRCEKLVNLYNSLKKQKNKDFVWLIIDDGSTDNTKDIVKKFKKNDFDIIYMYKKNGGKHTALNLAFKNLKTELSMIVDSDDILTNDAIERITMDWNKYSSDCNICGMCYLKKDINDKIVSNCFKYEEHVANYNEYIVNNMIKGDKEEIFKSNILSQYSFPEFKNEKFIGEGVLWSKISANYDMVFINYPVYVCEYLDDGLTKSGRLLRINNPNGGMYHSEEYIKKKYRFIIREKNALLFLTYARFANKKIFNLIKKSKKKYILLFNFLPSYFLFLYWKIKYNK